MTDMQTNGATHAPRPLGRGGPLTKAVALGCMSFGGIYGATDEGESVACLEAAMAHGIDHLDTALIYGMGRSEEIVGAFVREHPGRFTVATKAGIVPGPPRRFDNGPDYLREALEGSLERLGMSSVDLFYIHRREQERSIESVMETLVAFMEEGLIGGIGLSEVAPSTLRRAASVAPVAAVQNEYSLWSRQPELGLLQASHELGTAFVAFSPLARGMFGERDPDPARFPDGDFRRNNPRFLEPNFSANAAAIAPFRDWCRARGQSVAGVATAWTLAKWDHVIAIPGTRTAAHLAEWVDADGIVLTASELAEIDRILPPGFAHGDRYSDAQIVGVERYC